MHLPTHTPSHTNCVDLVHSKLVYRSDGLMEIWCDDETVYDVEIISEIIHEIGKLTGNTKCKQIIIAGKYTSITKEAREFAATKPAVEFTLAEAYVIQSLAQRLIANFYMKFSKPLVPTRVFTDREKAEKWIKSVQV